MRRSLRLVSVALLAVAPVVVGIAAPAGAAPAVGHSAGHHTAKAKVANSDISGAKATLIYTPSKVKGKIYPTGSTCSDKTASFTLTNTTAKAVSVTYGTQKLPIPAMTIEDICFTGTKGGTAVLGLKGSTATLTATLKVAK
jgi:hypothetical protein